MNKIKCALIGPGNIGTDLLYKLKRSPVLEPVWMVGIDATSEGLTRAREMGLKTTADGVDGLLPHASAPNRSALEWNACTLRVRVVQGRSASRAKSAA